MQDKIKALSSILGRKVTKDNILATMTQAGKSGVMGGVLDGFLGAAEAMKHHRQGHINTKTATCHATNEAACGFFTATAGTLGTTVAALVVGSMGPTALVVGMGVSVGARYLYRSNTSKFLPDFEEEMPLDDCETEELNSFWEALTENNIKPAPKKKSEK